MAGTRKRLVVAVTDARGRPIGRSGLGRWLEGHAPPEARGLMTIALVPDLAIKRLNRHYRGKNVATDVLSFPSGETSRRGTPRLLGDIAIGEGVARRQAREHGHALQVELR